jgi:hypothetical protein
MKKKKSLFIGLNFLYAKSGQRNNSSFLAEEKTKEDGGE